MFNIITRAFKQNLFRNISEEDIDLQELKQKQAQGAIIIDVRNNREFAEGHIRGSINIPEYEINRKFQMFVPNKNEVIVLYCTSGKRSKSALKKIKKMGYIKVYNLYGGMENYWLRY